MNLSIREYRSRGSLFYQPKHAYMHNAHVHHVVLWILCEIVSVHLNVTLHWTSIQSSSTRFRMLECLTFFTIFRLHFGGYINSMAFSHILMRFRYIISIERLVAAAFFWLFTLLFVCIHRCYKRLLMLCILVFFAHVLASILIWMFEINVCPCAYSDCRTLLGWIELPAPLSLSLSTPLPLIVFNVWKVFMNIHTRSLCMLCVQYSQNVIEFSLPVRGTNVSFFSTLFSTFHSWQW